MARTTLIRNLDEVLTLAGVAAKDGRHPVEADLGGLPKAAVLMDDDGIKWVGSEASLSEATLRPLIGAAEVVEVDARGCTALPAFVESHTHLIFAGHRAEEFEMRMRGATYQQIAEAGGGIRSTVKQTRAASEQELLALAQPRVQKFVEQGVGTLEVKSGYGLDLVTEQKILKVAQRLKGPRVIKTFLGPHAVAPEFSSTDAYHREVVDKMLPQIAQAKLADRIDIFIEWGYFSLAQADEYYRAGHAFKLGLSGHVEQMTRTGGAVLAAQLDAQSVDHLVQVSSDDIRALGTSDTTCVLLPLADLYLRMDYPPARALIDAGARVAVATDFNPGSAPSQDLSLVGVLARLEMGMTLPEVIAAYTFNGAAALGLHGQTGSLEAGKFADVTLIEGSWRDLFYQVGHHPVGRLWVNGVEVGLGLS
ncbi:MAG: imidazolonepropionase [Bdellovibrionales bacterium]|nr:imidazolonepropionase [Bdellovibrionales bacterium]